MSSLRLPFLLATLLAAGCALGHGGWGLVRTSAPAVGRVRHPLPGDAEALLLGVAGAGLVAGGLWLCAVALVAAGDLVGRRVRSTGPLRPSWLRAAVVRTCAPTLGAAVLCAGAPVAADPGDLPVSSDRHAAVHGTGGDLELSGVSVLSGLGLPVRPLSPPPTTGRAERPASDPVRPVRPGDSLWSIADDELGGRAGAARVARAWRQLYRANRHRIGPDPDLVLPGTRLRVPPTLAHHQHPSR